jgi:hypothetical protein
VDLSNTVGNFVAESGPEKFSADARGKAAQNWLNADCGQFNSAQGASDDGVNQKCLATENDKPEPNLRDHKTYPSHADIKNLHMVFDYESEETDSGQACEKISRLKEAKTQQMISKDISVSGEEKEEDLQEAKSTLACPDLQRAELIDRLLTPQMPASDDILQFKFLLE